MTDSRTMTRLPVTAVVLAGGRSSRMGTDKALLSVDGVSLVTRVVETVGALCERVIVVTNRPDAISEALPPGIDIIADEVAHQGPLGGIATALAASTTEWILVVAADMPWLRPEVVRLLWDARGTAQAVLPVGVKGPEPLLALYRRDCLPAARAALETGRRRVVGMFTDIEVVQVPLEQLREVDPSLFSLVNVNTPEELIAVREAQIDDVPSAKPWLVLSGSRSTDKLPQERPVRLLVNGDQIATMQATPADLEDLGVGFLVAEGILKDRAALTSVVADYGEGVVRVDTTEDIPTREALGEIILTSGCGRGLTFASMARARGIAHVDSPMRETSERLYGLVGELARAAVAYRDTGGMHACSLARDGRVLVTREDVGRHNAVDKVLGRAWLDGVPTKDGILVTTGRVSFEMAVKAVRAGVPIVVSRTAVTDLAAQVAEELGVTLVGYARGGKMSVYTHAERVVQPVTEDVTNGDASPAPAAHEGDPR